MSQKLDEMQLHIRASKFLERQLRRGCKDVAAWAERTDKTDRTWATYRRKVLLQGRDGNSTETMEIDATFASDIKRSTPDNSVSNEDEDLMSDEDEYYPYF